jgi:quercetin dioxygenase-like cupin family protein
MRVTRLADAPRYDAPKHFEMRSLRLQGLEASPADFGWVGLSHFLPGGGADMDSGALGKIYVVIAGQITVELAGGESHVLGELDSCFIAAGEARAVHNHTNSVASMLVFMPSPPRSAP